MSKEMLENIDDITMGTIDYLKHISKNEQEFWEYLFNVAIRLTDLINNCMPEDKEMKSKKLKQDIAEILEARFYPVEMDAPKNITLQ